MVARIGVLGPLTVDGDADRLPPRERVVLATLASRRDQVVSAETLADAWWGEQPPATWNKAIQGSLVQLRKALGPGAIETQANGYRLVVPASEVDVCLFEHQTSRARELLTLGEADRAAYLVDEALGLWRGRALVDLDGWDLARAEATRLDELRLEAEELGVEARLQAGEVRKVLAQARALVDEQPLREHRWALLALAQYQAGRQGDALRSLQRARRVLAEEVGLDPGPDLVALEEAILRQDPSLVTIQLPEPSGSCPYLGLVPYDIGDADAFFGRSDDVSECLRRLADRGTLTVVGPSGSGKSSIARAGIAASLRRDGRTVHVLTPGERPMNALSVLGSTPDAVLVVDQCEEVVTLCSGADERADFLDALVEHARRAPLVVTLRADRLGDVGAHPGFARVVERGLFLLQPMGDDDLRAAIEGPANQAGLRLEPGLVDLLVRDVEGEPGALPLLSHALRQTWQRREGRTLTVAGYQASGGIRSAVAQSAEQLYEQMPTEQRHMLRALLLRLVTPNPEGEPVRSRVPRRLVATDPEHEQIVERLIAARLVTSNEDDVELAHEALARAWPRLREWLDTDVDGQRTWRHLSIAADAWDAMGRPHSELYRGVRLVQALEWRDRAAPDLNAIEARFLDESDAERRHEEQVEAEHVERTARANRRLRMQLVALGAALAVALVVGAVAVDQRDVASDERRIANARELAAAANANLDVDPERSVLLALTAVERSRTSDGRALPEAEQALHDAVIASRAVLHVPGVGGAVAWNDNGTRFAAAGPDGSVSIHLDTGEQIRVIPAHDERVNGIAFSPDGRLLGTTSEDGHARLWDLGTGEQIHELSSEGEGDALAPAFDEDGSLFAAAWWNDGFVQILDVETGTARPIFLGDADTGQDQVRCCPRTATFDPDGRRILIASLGPSPSVVVDVETTNVLLDLGGQEVRSAAWSPDGSSIALAGADGDVQIVDASTGELRFTIDAHRSRVNDVDWSPDPDTSRLVTAGDSGTAKIWTIDDETGRELYTLSAQDTRAGIIDVEFSPDGTRVLTGDIENRAAIVWHVGAAGGAEVANVPAVASSDNTAAFSPDGRWILVGNSTGGLTVWDARTFTPVRTLGPAPPADELPSDGDFVSPPAATPYFVNSIAVNPEDPLVAAATTEVRESSWESSLRIWDIESGDEPFRVEPRGFVDDVAWTPDGALLAISTTAFESGRSEGWVTVVDRSGEEIASHREPDVQILSITFSADGAHLIGSISANDSRVSEFGEGSVISWDWARDEIVNSVEVHGAENALSPREDIVVSTPENFLGGSQVAEVWEWPSGRHLRTIVGNSGSVIRSAFSPDGARLATASKDGAVWLWDPYTGDAQLTLRGHDGQVSALAFSPDGSRLATAGRDGILRVWTLDLDELVEIAEEGLTRALSDDECRQYLHSRSCAQG